MGDFVGVIVLQGQTDCETGKSEKRQSSLNLYWMPSDIEESSGVNTAIKIAYEEDFRGPRKR